MDILDKVKQEIVEYYPELRNIEIIPRKISDPSLAYLDNGKIIIDLDKIRDESTLRWVLLHEATHLAYGHDIRMIRIIEHLTYILDLDTVKRIIVEYLTNLIFDAWTNTMNLVLLWSKYEEESRDIAKRSIALIRLEETWKLYVESINILHLDRLNQLTSKDRLTLRDLEILNVPSNEVDIELRRMLHIGDLSRTSTYYISDRLCKILDAYVRGETLDTYSIKTVRKIIEKLVKNSDVLHIPKLRLLDKIVKPRSIVATCRDEVEIPRLLRAGTGKSTSSRVLRQASTYYAPLLYVLNRVRGIVHEYEDDWASPSPVIGLPGEVPRLPLLLFLIDTSGSIHTYHIETMLNTIYKYADIVERGVLYYWDVEPHGPYPLKHRVKIYSSAREGGGTLIRPVLEEVYNRYGRYREKIIIIFTDGEIGDIDSEPVKTLLDKLAMSSIKIIFITLFRTFRTLLNRANIEIYKIYIRGKQF